MKRKLSLPGLLLGLLAAVVIGLLTSNLIGWLPLGLAVGIVAIAARVYRGRTRQKSANSPLTSVHARGR